MKYLPLGASGLEVSALCLGTMTFGQQNTEAEAHTQLDYAIAQGINFIDTAEMYPVPARAETQGRTEALIGSWLARQTRDRLIVATKIAGPSRGLKWIRGGSHAVDRANIRQAVEDSLQRLQTDYIDVYQIHWPDRYVPLFGETQFDPARDRPTIPIEEQLQAFAEVIQAGKIRYLGLSNETAWGVASFCRIAEQLGLPKVVSIQNAYHLMNRTFEQGLAECCLREQIGLLAYSPLAFGNLTGKYLRSADAHGRMKEFAGFGQRYLKPRVEEAIAAYVNLAQQVGLTPVELALAFVQSRWFMTSTIIGATTLEQLQENIATASMTLSPDVLAEVDAIHQRIPNPAP
ncbi:NADP(H)-dependent aldo-keto reductase [Leptolyngbya sp. AN02str]|uniref:NADP(H)-dependent aldo-keto reductase n=1 Tax=Leptolyngbya sp. AN02str TaxID=3423363 RepID=UPI003D311FE4